MFQSLSQAVCYLETCKLKPQITKVSYNGALLQVIADILLNGQSCCAL